MIDNLAEYQTDEQEEEPLFQQQGQGQGPVQNQFNNEIQQQQQNQPNQQQIMDQLKRQTDSAPTKEGFTKINSTYASDYYKQFSPYQGSYQTPMPSNSSNHELLKKLDNILHLLEEQQEEKTNLITEELILYVFLGVFVIYVLDSFVKVGKYTR